MFRQFSKCCASNGVTNKIVQMSDTIGTEGCSYFIYYSWDRIVSHHIRTCCTDDDASSLGLCVNCMDISFISKMRCSNISNGFARHGPQMCMIQ